MTALRSPLHAIEGHHCPHSETQDRHTAPLDDTSLTLRDVTIERRGLRLVDGLSLTLAPGQVLGVSGPSGCGKTTLLRCISELSPHYRGSIQRPQGRLSMVFQEHRLLPWKTIHANVMLPLKTADAFFRAEEWLERVHLADAMDLYPAQLSGGMRQRVAIARALATEPTVLLVDEPFSALDASLALELRHMLAELICHKQFITVWVSHDLEEINAVSTHLLHLNGPPGSWTLVKR